VRKRAGVAARARSKRRERALSWRREQALERRAREELRHTGGAGRGSEGLLRESVHPGSNDGDVLGLLPRDLLCRRATTARTRHGRARMELRHGKAEASAGPATGEGGGAV
jgi:hypothetical protein